jgi:hypothetical protein
MADDDCIFIKLVRREGKIVGHAVSSSRDFATQQPLLETDSDGNLPSLMREFEALEKEFRKSAIVYLDYMPIMFDLAPLLSSEAFVAALERFLENASSEVGTLEDGTFYKIANSSYSEFSKLAANAQSVFGVQGTLAKNGIMGLVATLDTLLASVVRLICNHRPEAAFGKDSTVKVTKLLEAVDINSLKSSLVEDKVAEVTRGSISDQVEWIEKRTSLDPIKPNFESWPVLGELYQRRHLFAHTNGRVSKQYLDCQNEHGYEINGFALGDEMGVGGDYYSRAVECVIEFATKFLHVLKIKVFKDAADYEPEAPLNQFCFELLQRGNYALANRLLEFAMGLRGKKSDKLQKMITVNYANALRLCEHPEKSKAVLGKVDWSSSSAEFLICVEAVKGNVELVVNLMRSSKGNPPLSEDAYRDWPAFYHIRESSEFKEVYNEVFGIPYEPSPPRMTALSRIYRNLGRHEVTLQLDGQTSG